MNEMLLDSETWINVNDVTDNSIFMKLDRVYTEWMV